MKSCHPFNIPADIPTSCLHTWQSFLNLTVSEWGDSRCFVLQKLPSFQLPSKFSASIKGAPFAIFGCPKKPYRWSWCQNSIYSHTFFGGIFATYLENYTISSCHQGSIVLLVDDAIFWCHIPWSPKMLMTSSCRQSRGAMAVLTSQWDSSEDKYGDSVIGGGVAGEFKFTKEASLEVPFCIRSCS